MSTILHIGNRNYSSWSLRAWLCLRWAGIAFEDHLINLDQDGYGERRIAEVLAVSPSGCVPALNVDGLTVWDTIGIAQWVVSRPEGTSLLPADARDRALMWSVVGEMHAGFAALRRDLPMNLTRRCTAYGLAKETLHDIARMDAIWHMLCRRCDGDGPYLFGSRSIADAFFLPVATRFRTYGTLLSDVSAAYVKHLLADADFLDWEQRAAAEGKQVFSRANIDNLYQEAGRSAGK